MYLKYTLLFLMNLLKFTRAYSETLTTESIQMDHHSIAASSKIKSVIVDRYNYNRYKTTPNPRFHPETTKLLQNCA